MTDALKIYESDLTTKPSWLGTYGDLTGKTLDADFGFNANGMYFTGNAGEIGPSAAYSVRTNWNISGHQVCEVTYTVDHSDSCSDQGVCFYNVGQSPNWSWDPDPSRIAFSANCPVPNIYGTNKFVNNSGEYYGTWFPPAGGSDVLGLGLYTFKVTYNPVARTVTAVTYQGSNTLGPVLDTIVLHEKLMDGGPYRIGFDADNDGISGGNNIAYFKNLTIKVYESNGVVDAPEAAGWLDNLKENHSQVTDLVENLFLFSDDADLGDGEDPNFNELGLGDVVFVQSDGKIVVGGQSGLSDNSRNLRRMNVDGTEDEGFMPPVFSGPDNGYIRDVAQQSDGKLIVVGHFTFADDSENAHIVRLHVDGAIDETFSPGAASSHIGVVKVLSDDRILIGGSFATYGETPTSYIALLSVDGVLDETFSNTVSLNDAVHAIEVIGDYSGGSLAMYVGGQFDKKIEKINEDGSFDGAFHGNLGSGFGGSIGGSHPRVASIKVQENGKVLVGHWFSTYNGVDCGKGLTRLNSNGTLDETFHSELFDDDWTGDTPDGNDHQGGVNTIALQDDGKIIVGGWFDNANGSWKSRIARINDSGSNDDTFDIGYGFSYKGWNWGPRIMDIKLDSDGNVYVAGSFTDYNHAARFQFAKLDTNGTLQEWSVLPPARQWGIDDGMEDLYDGGSYFNTNLTQPYIDIECPGFTEEGEIPCNLVGYKSIPSTHTMAWDDNPGSDFYDESIGSDESGSDDVEWTEHRYLPVTDSHVMSGAGYFGDDSNYFTAMFPGMFVLAANNINITEFSITGNIGTDGSGVDTANIYPITVGGSTYTVYLKSNYGGDDPSVNHIIIVDGNSSGIEQSYDDTSERDDHCITGLAGKTKLFYICVSKACDAEDDCGIQMSGSEATSIATSFLRSMIGCGATTYELDLSPDHPEKLQNYNYDGEGNMDTSMIVDLMTGKRRSIQRTGYFEITDGCGNKKVISVKDGDIVG